MTTEITNDCAIPDYGAPKQYELPNRSNSLLSTVVDKFKDLFCTTPRHTSILNKQTVRDAYPLPLPDEAHDRLAGSSVFTMLDLQSGYWQLPVAPEDQAKTAFCPGPGMGLYQFHHMPFGLIGHSNV